MDKNEYRLDESTIFNRQNELGNIGAYESREIMGAMIGGFIYNLSFIFFLFLVDYGTFYLIDWKYEIWGPLSLGWVIFLLGYSGWSHYLIKQFMAKTNKQTAEHYFRQGISAAYRQCYLAKENMTDEDFSTAINAILYQHRWE